MKKTVLSRLACGSFSFSFHLRFWLSPRSGDWSLPKGTLPSLSSFTDWSKGLLRASFVLKLLLLSFCRQPTFLSWHHYHTATIRVRRRRRRRGRKPRRRRRKQGPICIEEKEKGNPLFANRRIPVTWAQFRRLSRSHCFHATRIFYSPYSLATRIGGAMQRRVGALPMDGKSEKGDKKERFVQ